MLTSTLRWLSLGKRKDSYDSQSAPEGAARVPGGDLIFRMKSWPQLPEHGRTAEVYRILSVMSSQPVNRQWLFARCRMAPSKLDQLLMQLVADGALEVIDPARFARSEATAA